MRQSSAIGGFPVQSETRRSRCSPRAVGGQNGQLWERGTRAASSNDTDFPAWRNVPVWAFGPFRGSTEKRTCDVGSVIPVCQWVFWVVHCESETASPCFKAATSAPLSYGHPRRHWPLHLLGAEAAGSAAGLTDAVKVKAKNLPVFSSLCVKATSPVVCGRSVCVWETGSRARPGALCLGCAGPAVAAVLRLVHASSAGSQVTSRRSTRAAWSFSGENRAQRGEDAYLLLLFYFSFYLHDHTLGASGR